MTTTSTQLPTCLVCSITDALRKKIGSISPLTDIGRYLGRWIEVLKEPTIATLRSLCTINNRKNNFSCPPRREQGGWLTRPRLRTDLSPPPQLPWTPAPPLWRSLLVESAVVLMVRNSEPMCKPAVMARKRGITKLSPPNEEAKTTCRFTTQRPKHILP